MNGIDKNMLDNLDPIDIDEKFYGEAFKKLNSLKDSKQPRRKSFMGTSFLPTSIDHQKHSSNVTQQNPLGLSSAILQ